MSVSVCPSVTFVHCGHRVQWIPDTFECLDRWMSLLLTDNASPEWDDAGISGGRGKGSSRAILATARPSCSYCSDTFGQVATVMVTTAGVAAKSFNLIRQVAPIYTSV